MAEREDELTVLLTYRVSPADMDRLKKVAGPVARSLVAREAMRLGLEEFERDPERVMKIIPPERPSKSRPRRKRKPAE